MELSQAGGGWRRRLLSESQIFGDYFVCCFGIIFCSSNQLQMQRFNFAAKQTMSHKPATCLRHYFSIARRVNDFLQFLCVSVSVRLCVCFLFFIKKLCRRGVLAIFMPAICFSCMLPKKSPSLYPRQLEKVLAGKRCRRVPPSPRG